MTTLVSSLSGGANLVMPRPPGTLLDALQARSILARLGANIHVEPGASALPVITEPPVTFWVGEDPGADVAESTLEFARVGGSLKTVICVLSYTTELAAASSLAAFDRLLVRAMTRALALALDAAALAGDGVLQPQGLYGLSGVSTVPIGGALTFDTAQDLIAATISADADAETGAAAFVTTPGVARAASTTPRTTGSPLMLFERRAGVGELAGFPALTSTRAPTTLGAGANEHGIVFGADWSTVDVALVGAGLAQPGIDIVVDRYTQARRGIVRLTVSMYVDLRFPYPAAFAVGTGLTVP